MTMTEAMPIMMPSIVKKLRRAFSLSANENTGQISTALISRQPDGNYRAATLDGETAIGGKLPVNPSGGLKSKGHPVGATGVGQIVEVYEQLAGRSGERQVKGAKLGLAQNMGGSGGSSVVHILEVK